MAVVRIANCTVRRQIAANTVRSGHRRHGLLCPHNREQISPSRPKCKSGSGLSLRFGRSGTMSALPGQSGHPDSTASRPLLTSGHGYSFMPANAALRCQSNKAVRSSRAQDDGVVGLDL